MTQLILEGFQAENGETNKLDNKIDENIYKSIRKDQEIKSS